nr:MAG TPA: hypothetical protein [Caudoviricetes sp.]
MPKHETFRATSTPPIRSRTSARVGFHCSVICANEEVCRHALTAMARVGNCVRFSTSCFLCWINTAFSIKDTHPRKEESNKNVYVKHFCLQIFPTNILYHRTFKKLWYMF